MSTPTTVLKLLLPQTLTRAEITEVFHDHFQLIYDTALHITGNPHDADDVVQNIFLQLLRRQQPVRFLETSTAYFRRAARNQAFKIVHARKQVHLTGDVLAFDRAAAVDDSPPYEDKLGRLRNFIRTLRPEAALMIQLRYVDGLSNREIAQKLGKSETVVRATLWRLRKRLQKTTGGE